MVELGELTTLDIREVWRLEPQRFFPACVDYRKAW